MKKLPLILFFLLFVSCVPKTTGDSTYGNTNDLAPTSVPIKAVYLINGKAELSSNDLQAHPEVVVVQAFGELKQYVPQKIALWIDKSATPFMPEEEQWINEAPQAYYPIVLVGYSDTMYSFRDLLRLCCFMGPPIDWKLESGFSVIQKEEMPDPTAPAVTFIQGYAQKPTVQSILKITNSLLGGRLKAMPTTTFITIASPTP